MKAQSKKIPTKRTNGEGSADTGLTPGDAMQRLARAIYLDAQPTGDGRWLVWGGAQSHIVQADGRCDCTDFAMRRAGPCKHVYAMRLRQGNAETLRALRAIVAFPWSPPGPPATRPVRA